MEQRLKSIVMLSIGWTFIVLGVVGLFLPILQGILFLLVGLGILSKYSKTAHRISVTLRARYPSLDAKATAIADWWHRRVSRGRRADRNGGADDRSHVASESPAVDEP